MATLVEGCPPSYVPVPPDAQSMSDQKYTAVMVNDYVIETKGIKNMVPSWCCYGCGCVSWLTIEYKSGGSVRYSFCCNPDAATLAMRAIHKQLGGQILQLKY